MTDASADLRPLVAPAPLGERTRRGPSDPAAPSPARRRLRTLLHGPPGDPAWARPATLAVLALAAVLCLWNLSAGGDSNAYYAAAVKSATESWKALFFGSLDPASFITVDKPPLAIWLMGLSGRVFGFSATSMLVPEALCTVAAVGLLGATVRRQFGPAAGVVAALALALTPVAVAIGRVNDPDALLVLLLVASAWLLVRALETGRTRWLVACGVVCGLAFMTKMLQGWMVVPALALAYLVAGSPRVATRVRQLLAAGVAMVLVSAAWPLAVQLWPGSKPFVGGSTDGSAWDLIVGYNGFGRIFGEGGGMGGGGGVSFGGAAGLWRMVNAQVGGQIAWLLPFAALSLLAGLWLTRREPRTGTRRAGLLLFGVWALVLAGVFSAQRGIFHPYYVSALAPAVAALTGAGAALTWGWARRSWVGCGILGLGVAATAVTAVALLRRTPDFQPWLQVAIPTAAAAAILAGATLRMRRSRALIAVAVVTGAFAMLAGPTAYSVATVGRVLDGNNVTAGPAGASLGGGPGGGWTGAPPSGTGGTQLGAPPTGSRGTGSSGRSGARGGTSVSADVIAYLLAHQGSARYLVAAQGSQATAPIILQTGKGVVTIGGFSGSDPAPTVGQLARMVAKGELKYVLLSGSGGAGRGGPGGSRASDVTAWVKAHGTAVSGLSTTGGTLYAVTAS